MNLTLRILKISNSILSIIAIFFALFLLLFWLIPEFSLISAKSNNSNKGFVYKTSLVENDFSIDKNLLKDIPSENRIVIPKIYVDGEIYQGEDEKILDKGFWNRPNTSNPSLGGNTVIAGHRFQYTKGPNTFYHIDKLNLKDNVIIYWEGQEFVYEVFNIFEVYPNQTEIEDNTENSIVTIYTCTPVYTAEKRLVVQARLI